MNKVFIAFGSNMGHSKQIIDKAIQEIENNSMTVIQKSRIYETKPYGYLDQPNFINGVIEVDTKLSCREVLTILQDIEARLGRVREIHWGPRVIDLDIIFFNEEIYQETDLVVPHPDMHNREFVLKPLNDICPGLLHPILGKSVEEMLRSLK